MTHDAYDAIDATRWSMLKLMAKSPAHYHQALLESRKDTTALKFGRAVHLACLEPERFIREIAKWEGAVRRGKDWDAFQAEHKGQDILTESEYETCLRVSHAVRNDATAKPFLTGGKGEVSVRWTVKRNDYEERAKARIDFVSNAGVLVDLKTCVDASPEGFGRAAFRLAYHGQAAWYSDGYEAATGQALPFVIVAVEKTAPYVVQVYNMPADVMQQGRELYQGLLDKLVGCRNAAMWPGFAVGALDLKLPRWAYDEDETDAGGMGVTFTKEAANGDEF